jgi:ARC105 or Med15 subunit of Mediator complex non-fungal
VGLILFYLELCEAAGKMDAYTVKFQAMQTYVPFLNRMIGKLEKAGDKEKEAQLVKMKSLHGILTDPSKKVRFETLLKCEEVLQKLYEKVEGAPVGCSRSLSSSEVRPARAPPAGESRSGGERGIGGPRTGEMSGQEQRGYGLNSGYGSTSSLRYRS